MLGKSVPGYIPYLDSGLLGSDRQRCLSFQSKGKDIHTVLQNSLLALMIEILILAERDEDTGPEH